MGDITCVFPVMQVLKISPSWPFRHLAGTQCDVPVNGGWVQRCFRHIQNTQVTDCLPWAGGHQLLQHHFFPPFHNFCSSQRSCWGRWISRSWFGEESDQEQSLQQQEQLSAPSLAAARVKPPLSEEGLLVPPHTLALHETEVSSLPLFLLPWRYQMAAAEVWKREWGCSEVTFSPFRIHLHRALWNPPGPWAFCSTVPNSTSHSQLSSSPHVLSLHGAASCGPFLQPPAGYQLANTPSCPALLKTVLLYLWGFISDRVFSLSVCAVTPWREDFVWMGHWAGQAPVQDHHSCLGSGCTQGSEHKQIFCCFLISGEKKSLPCTEPVYLMSKGTQINEGE